MKTIRILLSLILVLGLIAGSLMCYAETETVEIIKDKCTGGAYPFQESARTFYEIPPTGGMIIFSTAYDAEDLQNDIDAEYWSWDASEEILTLKNWKNVSLTDKAIYIDRPLTINIVGQVPGASITSSKDMIITGKGTLTGTCMIEGSGDLFFNNAASVGSSIHNNSGNIIFNNSIVSSSVAMSIVAKKGNVEIYGSNIDAANIHSGNNIIIHDSVVFTRSTRSDSNDLYAANVLIALDSVLIFNYLMGEMGYYFDSSVALFAYDIAVKVGGKYYSYPRQYSLITESKLNRNFTLPYVSYPGQYGFAIPKGIKLTVDDGCYIDFNDKLQIDGKISGDVRWRDNCVPESFDVSCPLAIFPGEEIPLTVSTVPSNSQLSLYWLFSHPELISIDRNGVITLLPEAKNHIGEVLSIKATSIYYIHSSKSFEVFISNSGNNEKLRLPADLKEIEDQAFAGIDASEIYIPEGVEKIGSRIFDGCEGLKIIRMPDSAIAALSEDTFDGCDYISFICESSDGAAKQYAKDHGIAYLIGKVK